MSDNFCTSFPSHVKVRDLEGSGTMLVFKSISAANDDDENNNNIVGVTGKGVNRTMNNFNQMERQEFQGSLSAE